MRGLLLKDFALLKNMKTYAFMILVISLFMLLNGQEIMFITSYTTMLFVIIGTNTLHYDAFDNGYAFLFTLPITRKTYVLEKYVFSFLTAVAGIVFSLIVMCAAELLGNDPVLTMDNISYVVGVGVAGLIFLSFLLPVELKFGPEKSRIALIIVVAVIFAGVHFLMRGPFDFRGVVHLISQMKDAVLAAACILLTVGIVLISFLISCRIMEKKEY